MKNAARVKTLVQAAERFWCAPQAEEGRYPELIVDLIIFHKLHFYLPPEPAWKCFGLLQHEFVDWNEVRVSVVREIQEHLAIARNSLELAVFVKDFLEFVHKECRRVNVEHLAEENLTEIRRFLKRVKAIDPSTIDLVLQRRKAHPVLPLSAAMEEVLVDLGVVSKDDTHDRKSKAMFEAVGADNALAVHHYLLHHVHAAPNDAGDDYKGLPDALIGAKRRRPAAKTKATKRAKSKS